MKTFKRCFRTINILAGNMNMLDRRKLIISMIAIQVYYKTMKS